jgi:IKI3 family
VPAFLTSCIGRLATTSLLCQHVRRCSLALHPDCLPWSPAAHATGFRQRAGIHLRAFTLEKIASLLTRHDFKAAFAEAAMMRVDLNFLVDFLGPAFLEHVNDFVDQIGDPGAICDLVSALKPGFCTAPGGKYAGVSATHGNSDQPRDRDACDASSTAPDTGFLDKVSKCCTALRDVCKARGSHFLQAVVMSHLRCALQALQTLPGINVSSNNL